MKKILTLLITAIIATNAFGATNNQPDKSGYYSPENFYGKDVYNYKGQTLYLKGMQKEFRQYGYEGFRIDYKENSVTDRSNVYKCGDNFTSDYNKLAGKYFIVVDIIKDPRGKEDYVYANKYYLHLIENDSKDVIYFEYDSQDIESFPFIVVSYYTKLKNSKVGKKYIVRGRNWFESGLLTDVNTGKSINHFEAGGIWRCVDFTIDDTWFNLCLLIENNFGEQTLITLENSMNSYYVFDAKLAAQYHEKFGDINWQDILIGRIKVGMTKEMCRLSWGNPSKLKTVISGDEKNEEWSYSNGYILCFGYDDTLKYVK